MAEMMVEVLSTELEDGSLEETEKEISDILSKGRDVLKRLGVLLAKVQAHPEWYQDEYETFEKYIVGKWDISRQRGYQLIDFATVVYVVDKAGLPAPTNETHVRPLAKALHDHGPDHVAAIWDDLWKLYDGDITEKRVKEFLDGAPTDAKSKPGWTELLGLVGEELNTAEKKLKKLMGGVSRKPSQKFATLAEHYAERCDVIALNLRKMPGDWTEPGEEEGK